MQEIGVQPLVREDSTYGGATKPQLLSLCSRAQKPQLQDRARQLLKPIHPRAPLRNKRRYCNEEPALAKTRARPVQPRTPSTGKT